jgi:hypothetical protein
MSGMTGPDDAFLAPDDALRDLDEDTVDPTPDEDEARPNLPPTTRPTRPAPSAPRLPRANTENSRVMQRNGTNPQHGCRP